MLNEKEVAGKLNALAAEFRTLMEHKEYAKAKKTGRFGAFDGKRIVLA